MKIITVPRNHAAMVLCERIDFVYVPRPIQRLETIILIAKTPRPGDENHMGHMPDEAKRLANLTTRDQVMGIVTVNLCHSNRSTIDYSSPGPDRHGYHAQVINPKVYTGEPIIIPPSPARMGIPEADPEMVEQIMAGCVVSKIWQEQARQAIDDERMADVDPDTVLPRGRYHGE